MNTKTKQRAYMARNTKDKGKRSLVAIRSIVQYCIIECSLFGLQICVMFCFRVANAEITLSRLTKSLLNIDLLFLMLSVVWTSKRRLLTEHCTDVECVIVKSLSVLFSKLNTIPGASRSHTCPFSY